MAVGSNDGFQEVELNQVVPQHSLDFDAWTALISTVESIYNDDVDKISLAYDAFLSEFPLCYGYWKKYAEHHARLCSVENVVRVFERAVESVPYSVGLWVDYCCFSISSFADPSDVCRLFERGLSFVGKDYLCYLLWDKYIEFEYSQQHWDSLANIYIQTLKFPTKKLQQYYESFKNLVSIWEEETGLQESSHTGLQSRCESDDETMILGNAEISHVISNLLDPSTRIEALQKFKLIGECFYRKACALDAKLQKFEQNIHRPYFHVKPLDNSQLENWHRYLDLVEMEGDFDWAVKLYERCLVSCAHYPEFWMRYVDFVEANGGKEIASDAMDRATNIFPKNSPGIHLFNAWFKEKNGDIEGAHEAVLQCDQEIGSHFVDMVRRKANLEKRMGNYARASDVYKASIDLAAVTSPGTLPMLCLHYARFQCMVRNSVDGAREVLLDGIQRVPCSKLLLKELLYFSSMHDGAKQVDLLDLLIARALNSGSDVSGDLSMEDREQISTLYLEFIDSCGSIHDIRKAWIRHLKLFPHLVREQSSLKNSANAGAVLKMVAEGRSDFFDLDFQKSSVKNADKNEQTMNDQTQFEQGDEGLDCLQVEVEHSPPKSHIEDQAIEHDHENPAQSVDNCGSNGIKKQQELIAQHEKPISQDDRSSNPQDDESPFVHECKTLPVEASQEGIPISIPVKPLDKDAAETCNDSSSPSFTRKHHKDFSPVSSPTRPIDRDGSRYRLNSSNRDRSDYGSPENSGDRRDKSLSPRRRSSHGYLDSRHHRQRSLSPRRHNSRWNSDERWHRDRRQPNRRYPRYPDNSHGPRDGRMQNQHIGVIGNKGQSHNVQNQVVGSTSQDALPLQPNVYPQAQVNQYPLPNNEQYGDVQNTQLYNQMWQYYYQQQQLLLQQQSASQLPQSQQMAPTQQLQQQVQTPGQEQHVPTHQQSQVVPDQMWQYYYQQQQQLLLQQQQQQQQPASQLPQPHQVPPHQQNPDQEQHMQTHQQNSGQVVPSQQQQQSYQYHQLQQQQYLLYLQQLHQYQQSQQQPGPVQDQTLPQKQVELPENQHDQQMLPGDHHQNEDLSSQKDDGPLQVDSKANHEQNKGIDNQASASGATDQLPEIE